MNQLDGLQLNQPGFAYRDLLSQDSWDSFTVTAVLTLVGAATYVGRYRFVGAQCQFQITAVAATSIASTAGTSYFNLPVAAKGATGIAVMTNDTTNIAVGVCHVDVSTSRCYLPSQSASGNTFNVCGSYEV